MGYSTHALKGAGWNGILQVITTLLAAVKIAVLARILSPNDFGLFALVAVAIGIVESLTETGINATIIQSQKSTSYFLDTAWVISIVRGLIISIVMILMGFGMQYFYNSPQLFILVGVASLIPLIKGFINPAIVTLQRELRFFRDSVYRLLRLVVEVVCTIVFALALQSVYALILGLIASAVFEVFITFVMFKERPRLIYVRSRAAEIFNNMKGLNMMAILSYIAENIDNIIVGKVVGTSALGIYQNSYGFTHKLNLQLAKSVQFSTLPVYARINADTERVKKAFLKTLSVSIGSFILIAIPFFFLPELTVRILLGEKWLAAVPLIRPLLLAGIIQSVASVSSALLVVRRVYFWLNANLVITTVMMIVLVIALGSRFGLIGVVYGVLIARLIAMPVSLYGVYQTLRQGKSSWKV